MIIFLVFSSYKYLTLLLSIGIYGFVLSSLHSRFRALLIVGVWVWHGSSMVPATYGLLFMQAQISSIYGQKSSIEMAAATW